MSLGWYVIQAYSGYELYVKRALEEMIKLENLQDRFGEILVPTEEIVEIRGGKRRKSDRKFFPGYVLAQIDLDDDVWHKVRQVPKVLGFLGGKVAKPVPISNAEVDKILNRMEAGVNAPKPKVLFEPGELVRITNGPFADFNGAVEEVNYEKNRLRVAVLIFGRSTPVDLDFSQVEKG